MNRILSEGSSIIRAAFYGRYSSTMQRLASLEDQKRTCTKYADGAGWIVLEDHCYYTAGHARSPSLLPSTWSRITGTVGAWLLTPCFCHARPSLLPTSRAREEF